MSMPANPKCRSQNKVYVPLTTEYRYENKADFDCC